MARSNGLASPGKYTQIRVHGEKERAQTIYDPETFAMHILADRDQLYAILSLVIGVAIRGRILLLVLVVNHAPGVVNSGLNLRTVTELQFHELA